MGRDGEEIQVFKGSGTLPDQVWKKQENLARIMGFPTDFFLIGEYLIYNIVLVSAVQ